jgi:hypothetical protein
MKILSRQHGNNTLLGEFEEAVSTTQVLSGWLFALVAKIW